MATGHSTPNNDHERFIGISTYGWKALANRLVRYCTNEYASKELYTVVIELESSSGFANSFPHRR